MLLIVGGAASGKREYAKSLGYRDEDMADGVLDQRPVLYNLQDLVAACPLADQERLLDSLTEKAVVICDTVGDGVIPIDRQQRQARELTGRLCVLLAQKAERVVRMICGLPQIVKG